MIEFALDIHSLLRFCGFSAFLLGIYYVLYDRKASFVHCRCFLLLLVPLSFLVSVVRVPVYDAGREIVLCPLPSIENAEVLEEAGREHSFVAEVAAGTEEEEMVSEEEVPGGKRWMATDMALGGYAAVAFILLLRWLFGMMAIFRLKKWGTCFLWQDVRVIRNNRVASPFSFFKMIFVHRKLQGETLEVVLAHEMKHIEHKHYRDTLLIEMCCIFFWFNPLVWWIKKELKATHEFEVDRNLLDGGLELSKYQNIIFNELMGYGPAIANGFHNSMIKKRFIMMKTVNGIRYALLRKIVVLPAVAGLFVLFAFTDKEMVREYIWQPVGDIQGVEEERVEAMSSDEEIQPLVLREEVDVVLPPSVPPVPLQDDTLSNPSGTVSDTVEHMENTPFKGREGFTFYPLSEEQVVVSLWPFVRQEKIKYIETDREETRVTILVPVYYDSNWVQFNKGFCMIDKASGDIYMLRSMTRGIELNKTYVVRGHKNRMVEFTMVFPPLKKGVKVVSLFPKYPEMGAPMPSNGGSSYFRNVRIADYRPPKDFDRYYDKEGYPASARKMEYVLLRNDQMVYSALPFERVTKIKSIVTDKDATRLTVAVPIYYDSNWVQFNRGFCIEDCRTGDVYEIQSVERGIELNKTLVIREQKGKMLEFTMIFPPLNKKVKTVNIYLKYPEKSGLAPTNRSADWNWRRVRLADYQKEGPQIYY